MLEQLKAKVHRANLDLVAHGLVTLTWGNASGISDDRRHVVIKPSGVSYDAMRAEDMVVVDLHGNVVEGELQPSSDTATHLVLYREFNSIGGVVHTHSTHATMFAQARQPIACYGTTHADHFYGPVPVTRALTEEEAESGYEVNTGHVIVERFTDGKKKMLGKSGPVDPVAMPAVLVAGHAPFTWGSDAAGAVKNAVALEAVAQMALGTMQLTHAKTMTGNTYPPLEQYVLDKHYQRKHGPDAYYGQKK